MTVEVVRTKLNFVAEVVCAFVSKNTMPPEELPGLIINMYAAFENVRQRVRATEEPAKQRPAVPIGKSVTPDHIVSLEDRRKFQALKRYLRTSHNMSPEQYRAKWGLPATYPMVAPNYTIRRSDLAKAMGLGLLRKDASTTKAASIRHGRPLSGKQSK